MRIENLAFTVDAFKVRITYTGDAGHVVSDWDRKEFQQKVDLMGWRKWDMQLVQAGKVTGHTYGLMTWEEYFDFLTRVDMELFVSTFENVRRRNAKDGNRNDAGQVLHCNL